MKYAAMQRKAAPLSDSPYVCMQSTAGIGSSTDKEAAGRLVTMRPTKVAAMFAALGNGAAQLSMQPISDASGVCHGSPLRMHEIAHCCVLVLAGPSLAHICRKRADEAPRAACQFKTLIAKAACRVVICTECASIARPLLGGTCGRMKDGESPCLPPLPSTNMLQPWHGNPHADVAFGKNCCAAIPSERVDIVNR